MPCICAPKQTEERFVCEGECSDAVKDASKTFLSEIGRFDLVDFKGSGEVDVIDWAVIKNDGELQKELGAPADFVVRGIWRGDLEEFEKFFKPAVGSLENKDALEKLRRKKDEIGYYPPELVDRLAEELEKKREGFKALRSDGEGLLIEVGLPFFQKSNGKFEFRPENLLVGKEIDRFMLRVRGKILEQRLQKLLEVKREGDNLPDREVLEALRKMVKSGSFIYVNWTDLYQQGNYTTKEMEVVVVKDFKPVMAYSYQLEERENFPRREWEAESWAGLSDEEKDKLVKVFEGSLQDVIEFARRKAGENLPALVEEDYFRETASVVSWKKWDETSVSVVIGNKWKLVKFYKEDKYCHNDLWDNYCREDYDRKETHEVVKKVIKHLKEMANTLPEYDRLVVYQDYDEYYEMDEDWEEEWEETEETGQSLDQFLEEVSKKKKGNSPSP